MTSRTVLSTLLVILTLSLRAGAEERTLEVTATAYNSVAEQTDDEPWLAAWGDSLANGMKVIAVSRDLLELGLARGSVVEIDGLPGEYTVLDKMNKRWKRKIDVYMGDDIAAARVFGRQDVVIRWQPRDAIPAVGAGPPEAAAALPTASSQSLVAETEPN